MSAANENLDPAQRLKHTIGSLSVGTCDLIERATTHLKSPGGQPGLGFAHLLAIGAPEEIRTPDPQIRSLVGAVEIIEVRTERNSCLNRSFSLRLRSE
jgi:hypothetical protein